jgi:hypothetical protein
MAQARIASTSCCLASPMVAASPRSGAFASGVFGPVIDQA